jgi:hypothetical protein
MNMYATNDLSRAAFLMVRGHELAEIVRSHGRYCTFIFSPDAAQDAASYDRGASVPARMYAQAARKLTAMAHQARKESSL